MANLASFISELAMVSGVKADSLKTFIEANKAVEIPDDVVSGIRGGILTMEAAKNNTILHDHFHAQALNGVDTDLERFMGELKLDDKIISEIKTEPKTAKRVRLLATKLRDLEAEKINAKGGEQKVLQEKIEALNNQLAAAHAEAQKQANELNQKISEAQQAYQNKLRDYKMNEHFAGYQYANDKTSQQIQAKFAATLMDEKMKELGLKTAFDADSGQVKLLTSSDTIFYKDNKPVDFRTFTDNLLAENHLLKVSDKPKAQGNPTIGINNNNGSGGTPRDLSKMAEALNKSLVEVQRTN